MAQKVPSQVAELMETLGSIEKSNNDVRKSLNEIVNRKKQGVDNILKLVIDQDIYSANTVTAIDKEYKNLKYIVDVEKRYGQMLQSKLNKLIDRPVSPIEFL
jgi:hypothetical protein